jgi:hypothetical protein
MRVILRRSRGEIEPFRVERFVPPAVLLARNFTVLGVERFLP